MKVIMSDAVLVEEFINFQNSFCNMFDMYIKIV